MPVTAAKRRAINKYNDKTYDVVTFRAYKGKKDDYKAHATKLGMSFNAFVVKAIEDAMQKDPDKQD